MRRKQATAEWTAVRQRAPRRAWIRLGTYLIVGIAATVFTDLLFSTEPEVLMSGVSNPAAKVPTFVGIVAFIAVVLSAVRALRPPQLAANHYGVTVRPGAFRSLLLPWVHLEEVTAAMVPGRREPDAYILFACDDHCGRHSGDRPRFLDRAALREANRATEGRVGDYDLALRLSDFTASPADLIDQLAGYAPAHVDVLNQLDQPLPNDKSKN